MPIERTKRTVEIITIFNICNHKPKLILDLGYGDGQITDSLRKKGYDVIGLDVSKNNYETARKRFPECDFRLYDGLNIPFEKEYFDTVILNDVLEHIPYSFMDELIEKIKEVIKLNGIIFISTTNRYELVEPHTSIPLLTWLPRIFWNSIDHKLNKSDKYHISEIYPYTFRKLKTFCKRHDLYYQNFTHIYTIHKFMDLEYIGNRWLRSTVKLLSKVRMLKIFYYLACKVSVLIFICKVKKNVFSN